MVSWRAPVSILDAPRLDFGASKAGFWRHQAFWLLGSAIPRQPKMPKMVKYVKKASHLQGPNAQSATTRAYSTTMAWAKKGGRRWSPPGVTIT